MLTAIKLILQMIGLAVVVWFVWVACEEYKKIRQEEKEKNNGQPREW